MATYERSVWVDAPLERVWKFYSRAQGLIELTPDWLDLRVESIRSPDGEMDPGVLAPGSRVTVSVQPLGVGPRRRWISEIVEREEGDGHALFRDVMHDGPFPRWEHTHRFSARDGGTEVTDHVEYDLPCGPFGRALGPVGVVGFEPVFWRRHRRTKELLEE